MHFSIQMRAARSLALAMGATTAVVMLAASANAAPRRERPSAITQNTISGPAVMAIVSLKSQRVSLYDGAGGVIRARVSSGRTEYETPVGIYSILQKKEQHYSNLYDDASMPFMQRITWSGIALHEGALPGYPASHGCVRMPGEYASEIFPLTKIGMRVIVARDDIGPSSISHAFLPTPAPALEPVAVAAAYEADSAEQPIKLRPFQPDVSAWPARQAQIEDLRADAAAKAELAKTTVGPADEAKRAMTEKAAQRARLTKALRTADTINRYAADKLARTEKSLGLAKAPKAIKRWEEAKVKAATAAQVASDKLAAVTAQIKIADEELARATLESSAAEGAKAAALSAAKDAERKTLPLSIFVSLKSKRLYVRQGHEAVMDMPVEIAEPDQPIGTHVFTAVDYGDQAKGLKWTAVSLERRSSNRVAENSDNRARRTDAAIEPPATDVAAASAALDRIKMPPEVLERIAGYVWPGSSLIVSDEDLSRETGPATDFIVLISGEPQGGIKHRPRQSAAPPRFDRYYADDYYMYDRYGRPQRYRPPPKSIFNWW